MRYGHWRGPGRPCDLGLWPPRAKYPLLNPEFWDLGIRDMGLGFREYTLNPIKDPRIMLGIFPIKGSWASGKPAGARE